VEWILSRRQPWPDRLFGIQPVYALWAG